MKLTLDRVDHLVYAVPDLDEAVKELEKKLGVAPVPGGKHRSQGTHNALVHLGNNSYLEIIAPDPDNTDFTGQRWMGIDLIDRPTITRWAVSTNDLDRDRAYLATIDPQLGGIKGGSRKRPDGTKLIWKATVVLPEPKVEVLPFVIDWKGTDHPARSLPQVCQLVELRGEHPTPWFIETAIHSLNVGMKMGVADEPAITAIIETPKGRVELS
ncbi:MAG TPA: VOC family protein [Bacteroidetes bacterium]|nr:VOC family protein [Bacteroidota bacterium]